MPPELSGDKSSDLAGGLKEEAGAGILLEEVAVGVAEGTATTEDTGVSRSSLAGCRREKFKAGTREASFVFPTDSFVTFWSHAATVSRSLQASERRGESRIDAWRGFDSPTGVLAGGSRVGRRDIYSSQKRNKILSVCEIPIVKFDRPEIRKV